MLPQVRRCHVLLCICYASDLEITYQLLQVLHNSSGKGIFLLIPTILLSASPC